MKCIPLVLSRKVVKGRGESVRILKDDLQTISGFIDMLDNGKMKRGLIRGFDKLAEELMDREMEVWPEDALEIGEMSTVVDVTPEQLEKLNDFVRNPPDGVMLMGARARSAIGLIIDTQHDYENGHFDKEDEEALHKADPANAQPMAGQTIQEAIEKTKKALKHTEKAVNHVDRS